MIDANSTSDELKDAGAEIAFLPVGACEQHFGILPLDADIRQSARLAADIAAHFNSYVLPPLPFGTSMENSGAPGTVTLMPATLDAVAGDVVDSLYRQGFEIVVILNSHGGNFALRPAVRRINYLNPGKKTIFVDPWELAPQAETAKIFEGTNELHCGEIEVSVMLHLWPDAVRTANLEDGDPDALRVELDMFSVHALAGGKPWGLATRATAEKGKAFYELMLTCARRFIRRVIERHRRMPGYHG